MIGYLVPNRQEVFVGARSVQQSIVWGTDGTVSHPEGRDGQDIGRSPSGKPTQCSTTAAALAQTWEQHGVWQATEGIQTRLERERMGCDTRTGPARAGRIVRRRVHPRLDRSPRPCGPRPRNRMAGALRRERRHENRRRKDGLGGGRNGRRGGAIGLGTDPRRGVCCGTDRHPDDRCPRARPPRRGGDEGTKSARQPGGALGAVTGRNRHSTQSPRRYGRGPHDGGETA